jgi:transcriptional regulator with XRE-family HTH domain
MMLVPDQIRAARAWLNLRQEELAKRAHVSTVTIRRVESADYVSMVAPSTIAEIRQALENSGVEFIDGGIKIRRPAPLDRGDRLEQLKLISARSAARLRSREMMVEADLYDDAGLPA